MLVKIPKFMTKIIVLSINLGERITPVRIWGIIGKTVGLYSLGITCKWD